MSLSCLHDFLSLSPLTSLSSSTVSVSYHDTCSLFPTMRIFLQMLVTCFGTVGCSLSGVIQVSDRFHVFVRVIILYVSTRGLTLLVSSLALHPTHIPPVMTDARSADRMGNYTKFWDKDREHEKSEVQGARVDNYTELVNG